MNEQENIIDDGTFDFALRFAASLIVGAGLANPDSKKPEDAGRAFLGLKREVLSELAITLYAVTKRWYAEHPPSPELLAEWESMKQ